MELRILVCLFVKAAHQARMLQFPSPLKLVVLEFQKHLIQLHTAESGAQRSPRELYWKRKYLWVGTTVTCFSELGLFFIFTTQGED